MQFQRTPVKRGKNKGAFVLSFYCRNKESCIRHDNDKAVEKYGKKLPRSIRLKYITAHIEWTLRHCTKDSLKAYRLYIGRLEEKLAVDKEIAKRKLKDAKTDLKQHEAYYARYQNLQLESLDDYNKHHKGKLEQYEGLITASNGIMNKLEAELKVLSQKLPTRKEFVELIKSYLLTLLNTTDIIEEDLIYQEVVSNLRAGNNSISVIKLNPPYNLMVDLSKVSSGRGNRT